MAANLERIRRDIDIINAINVTPERRASPLTFSGEQQAAFSLAVRDPTTNSR
jgi:hypothetical protein